MGIGAITRCSKISSQFANPAKIVGKVNGRLNETRLYDKTCGYRRTNSVVDGVLAEGVGGWPGLGVMGWWS